MSAANQRVILQRVARDAMIEYGLDPEFPPAARAEADRLAGADLDRSARDMRALPWCSIDNDDSRDLDQLTVAELSSSLPGAAAIVRIAIADVCAVVRQNSALDTHARKNTTSVYTPSQVFPMLPERLSTDLTSLNPNEDRMAVVIEMVVGQDGQVMEGSVYRAAVRNHAKLAYRSVGRWLDGEAAAPEAAAAVEGLERNLRLQDEAAGRLRDRRHQHGALELESLEPRAVFEDDAVTDLRLESKNRATDLIEDFMIAANGTIARFLERKGVSSLRRVVRSPERWARIVNVARTYGAQLPETADPGALAEFLHQRRVADPVRFPDLSLTIVKLLGRGEYVVETAGGHAPGHFGLAVEAYTHSTAPNRRFPDLITQRLITGALAGQSAPYREDELQDLARHCTEQEGAANKVERRVRKAAAALLLQSRIGEVFDGIVTGASEKGTWIRILQPPVEGKLEEGTQGLEVGHKVRVRLVHTDVTRGFIDFVRVR